MRPLTRAEIIEEMKRRDEFDERMSKEAELQRSDSLMNFMFVKAELSKKFTKDVLGYIVGKARP